jgi:RNase P/RNase MRP subunit p29
MKNKNIIIALAFVFVFSAATFAQEVSVVLKNSKVVVGRIVEEKPEYLILDYELGQLRVDRNSIESISYNPFVRLDHSDIYDNTEKEFSKAHKFTLKDPVVVYLRNGNVVAGLLLAKSLNMVMLQTESGNLTIPKRDLQKIEYISGEYAERGEIVIAHLNNGQRFEGNIYFEDSNELSLDTELGRLTLPKNKLRTLEYTGKTGVSKLTMADQYLSAVINQRFILPRYDVIDVGYTTKFGSNFGPGFGLGYQSRFSIAQFEGLNLSAVAGLSLNYFVLNEDNIIQQNPTLNANLKGGAFITTVGAGGQLNIYPQTASFYDFYVAPMLEGHLIYLRLEQEYPSFPQFNTSETKTEFKLGLGVRFGAEFLFDSFKLGLQYNVHHIFGTDGFNQISLTFVKPLF